MTIAENILTTTICGLVDNFMDNRPVSKILGTCMDANGKISNELYELHSKFFIKIRKSERGNISSASFRFHKSSLESQLLSSLITSDTYSSISGKPITTTSGHIVMVLLDGSSGWIELTVCGLPNLVEKALELAQL